MLSMPLKSDTNSRGLSPENVSNRHHTDNSALENNLNHQMPVDAEEKRSFPADPPL